MGKSPGKWIKFFLLGKKSSKSSLSKAKDIVKSASKKEVLVSSKVPVPNISADPPLDLSPASGIVTGSEHRVTTNVSIEGVASSCIKEDRNTDKATNIDSQEDLERIRQEIAAIKAQAAVRGYLARRAFRTLKSIIRLQAFIRGHLVRRQAVATLCCVRAIVKFQARARGQKVRRSTVGIGVQNACNLQKIQDTKCLDSSGIYAASAAVYQMENVFAQKLLALSSTTVPLRLEYGSGESNSACEWLERWTKSQFWASDSQRKKNVASISVSNFNSSERVMIKNSRPKQSVQKPSSFKIVNSSSCAISESEKPKRNPRKLSSHSTNSVQEQGTERVKCNRKTSDSKKQAGEIYEVDNGKPKHRVSKASDNTGTEVSELGTNDSNVKKKGVSKPFDVDASPKPPPEYDQGIESPEHPQPTEDSGKTGDIQGGHKQLDPDHHPSIEDTKASQRRSSLPANIEHQENGVHSMRKVPSYMAPTESAKAKLRAQEASRFSEDVIEKYDMTRRHSLPSSINGKLTSMSPRVQRLVHSATKGSIRSDRSLSSSRDGIDKMIKPEWRR